MSYTIEVYRGNHKAERHFGIYALYVMFYPQLVAGPIERPQNILYQFRQKRDFDYTRVTNGLKLMLWGFFKKMVIADNMGLVVDHVYINLPLFKGLGTLTALIAFAFQIYCDFSGYCDIAIGAAEVMGFTLMPNFKNPFVSKNVTEFWRRWHISLSTWFNDYLFNPLVISYRDMGKFAVVLALLITFFISGVWHGAGSTFIAYGLMHGVAVSYEFLTKKARKKVARLMPDFLYNNLSMLLTFLFVCNSWVFFRVSGFHNAIFIIKNVFTVWQINDLWIALSVWGKSWLFKVLMLIFLIAIATLQYYHEHYGSVRLSLSKQPIIIRWGIYLTLILCIFIFGVFGNRHFIYFQF